VACLGDADCKDPAKAKCDKGSCVPCTASEQCKAFAATPACDAGKCVECKLGEEMACSGGKTCDLVAKKCVAIAAGSVKNCKSCTNDLQCEKDHRCIAMDFMKKASGYYCLKDAGAGCAKPFSVPINKSSLSSAAATNYCGIDQDVATCEAVLALIAGWVCTKDGMCGPEMMPEVAVPGALCKKVGVLNNQCTYACGTAANCPASPPANTCGPGIPGWCGG
jgi:hypothetical protein